MLEVLVCNSGMKRKTIPLPSITFLRECFDYSPESGDLIWKSRPIDHFFKPRDQSRWNKLYPGKVAGNKVFKKGIKGRKDRRSCIQVTFWDRETRRLIAYTAHRIIFALMEVEIPEDVLVDHRDFDPWNNKWKNLRLATHTQSSQYRQRRRGKQSDLPTGIHWCKRAKKYYVYIRVNKKLLPLGYYHDLEEAKKIRREAEIKYFGEFAFNPELSAGNSLTTRENDEAEKS